MNNTSLFENYPTSLLHRIDNYRSITTAYFESLRILLSPECPDTHPLNLFRVITNTIMIANDSEPDECVSGILYLVGAGKNRSILEKTAASFRSVGVKCFFLAPDDLMHGDLGTIKPNDIVITVSKSGESLNYITDYLNKAAKGKNPRKNLTGLSLFHITMAPPLDIYKHNTFQLPVVREMDFHNILPLSSTLGFQIFLDLIVSEVAMLLGTSTNDLGGNHPSGAIGKLLNN